MARATEQLQSNRRIVIISALALGLFSLITMGLVFVFYFGTEDKIALSEAEHEQFILQQIVGVGDVRFVPRNWNLPQTGEEIKGYLIIQQDRGGTAQGSYDYRDLSGIILSTHTLDGYSGRIDLLVGVNLQNQVIAVGVTKHRETPGLGDKIEKGRSNWIDQFHLLGKDTNWDLKKNDGDFDSLSGATISSRAVIKAVEWALRDSSKLLASEAINN